MSNKRYIHLDEFNRRVRKQYSKSKVAVRLGELELILKAAKRCLQFAIMNDTLLGGGLAVEDEEMAKAYKSMSEYVKEVKEQTLADIKRKLERTFTTEMEV